MLANSWSTSRRLTWSVMERWLSCRRRWYYRYVGRFAPPPGMALLEGKLLHSLFDAEAKHNKEIQQQGWEAADKMADLRAKHMERYVASRLKTLDPFFEEHKKNALAPLLVADPKDITTEAPKYTEEDVTNSVELLKKVFANWLRLRGAEDLRQYEVLMSEYHFDGIQLLTPDGRNVRGWRLGGVIDALLRDRNTGQIILREYKTTGGDVGNYEKRVDLDPQVRLYARSAEIGLLTQGEPIEAVQYVVLRKKTPTLPKDITCPDCKKKSVSTESCETCSGTAIIPSSDKRLDSVKPLFLEYLEQKGFTKRGHERERNFVPTYGAPPNQHDEWSVHERYVELYNNLPGWEKFIGINTFYLDPVDKEEAMSEAWQVAQEIAEATKRFGRHGDSHVTCFPRNTSQCSGPAGFCEYKQVCMSRMSVEEIQISGGWQTDLPDSPEIEALQQAEITKLEAEENEFTSKSTRKTDNANTRKFQ